MYPFFTHDNLLAEASSFVACTAAVLLLLCESGTVSAMVEIE
jgi:hypothetical protein